MPNVDLITFDGDRTRKIDSNDTVVNKQAPGRILSSGAEPAAQAVVSDGAGGFTFAPLTGINVDPFTATAGQTDFTLSGTPSNPTGVVMKIYGAPDQYYGDFVFDSVSTDLLIYNGTPALLNGQSVKIEWI